MPDLAPPSSPPAPSPAGDSPLLQMDFVGVGAAKAGTTWLAACLAEHPGICMSDPKELDYFCEKAVWPGYGINHGRSERWLQDRFSHGSPGQIKGEYSNNYLCDPTAPARILAQNPACKIIFCARNPVEALYSYYFQAGKELDVPDTFEGFLETYPSLVEMGLYHHHLQAYLETFPAEQICLLVFDDFKKDPRAALANVFRFLGVEDTFVPPSLTRRVNETGATRHLWLRNAMARARTFLQHHPLGIRLRGVLWNLKVHHLAEWVQAKNQRPTERKPLLPATRARLIAAYREDVLALSGLYQRDFSAWLRQETERTS